jgi:hypothetical protein
VDDIAGFRLALRQIVFSVWVILTEHKWVTLAERRGRGFIAMGGVDALSRRVHVQCGSISMRPGSPVDQWRKLLHGQSSGFSTRPRVTGLLWM